MFGNICNGKEPESKEALVATPDVCEVWGSSCIAGTATVHRPDTPPMSVTERASRRRLIVMETMPQIHSCMMKAWWPRVCMWNHGQGPLCTSTLAAYDYTAVKVSMGFLINISKY